DYIGRPIQAYSEEGALVWSTDYDIYGKLRNLVGDRMFIPFRQLGQYEDIELDGLYYNRFRYYDSNSGLYIAKDPIGLAGNNPTFYAYVWDSNGEVDVFGLELITVYRFDERPPSIIKSSGGFVAWSPNSKVSLSEYVFNNTHSQYIGTSYNANDALGVSEFYDDGFLYKIEIDDSKGINVNSILGDHIHSYENEFAIRNEILNENIKGVISINDIDNANNIKWNKYK
ncbi:MULTISPECIES: RHS repeat domain-containing protein, partial [unclassified Myroides]|uniref:RHS repeat domain-containing protein n=1 Tax=unclassified Myroides TaxID=2642485 RepID=UPI003D2F5A6D